MKKYIFPRTCQIPSLSSKLIELLTYRTSGTFIEVGAFDGQKHSNVSGLADIGWKGFCIEPIRDSFNKCKTRHRKNKNVSVHNLAISNYCGEIEINPGKAISTCNEEMLNAFEADPEVKVSFKKPVKVKCQTLTKFADEQGIRKKPHLLSIDVEGLELEVLQGFDLKRYRPFVIIIELHENNPDFYFKQGRVKKCIEILEENGYIRYWNDDLNSIFVEKTHADKNNLCEQCDSENDVSSHSQG